MKARAAVAWEPQKPLVIEEIDVEGPQQGEVLLQVVATGVCHTDAFTLSGDEPEGALALGSFLHQLEQKPELAQGYALFIYPVCNPTGFEDNTRHARSGKDLNREFWRDSAEP